MNIQEILLRIEKERKSLEETINSTPSKNKVVPIMGDWTIKDIIMHLVWWEQHFLEMLQHADDKEYPARLQDKKLDIKKINAEVFEQYKNIGLKDAEQRFAKSYKEILNSVEKFPEERLLKKVPYEFSAAIWEKHIGWDTYNHYKWARTQIKKGLKRILE